MTENKLEFGIVNVYKPVGMTSFSVVSRIRKIFSVKKAGHCGTLDPFASGVLPVCIGKATRVIRYMDKYDKTYRCGMVFGRATDTQDVEGKTVLQHDISDKESRELQNSDYQIIREAFSRFHGKIWQKPPMYSALKVDGKPLYAYARDGVTLEIPPRQVQIYNLQVERIYMQDVLRADFSVTCSKGTYIRTICHDVGEITGLFGHADTLERTGCGLFTKESSHTLEELEDLAGKGRLCSILLPEDTALMHLPRMQISKEEAKKVRMGQHLAFSLCRERLAKLFPKEDYLDRLLPAYLNDQLVCVFRIVRREGTFYLSFERVFA